jgi:hypothetical protein
VHPCSCQYDLAGNRRLASVEIASRHEASPLVPTLKPRGRRPEILPIDGPQLIRRFSTPRSAQGSPSIYHVADTTRRPVRQPNHGFLPTVTARKAASLWHGAATARRDATGGSGLAAEAFHRPQRRKIMSWLKQLPSPQDRPDDWRE